MLEARLFQEKNFILLLDMHEHSGLLCVQLSRSSNFHVNYMGTLWNINMSAYISFLFGGEFHIHGANAIALSGKIEEFYA